MIERVALFILCPFSLAGGLEELVRRQARLLRISPTSDQVRYLVWFIQREGEVEIPAMHQYRVHRGLISTSAEPSEALFKSDPLCYRERPVDGVQLGMPVYTTVVSKVSPENRTRIRGDTPFSFSLQELEPSWSGLEHGSRTNAARSVGNTAVSLNLRGIRAVVGGKLIAVFYDTIGVTEAISIGQWTS